MHMNCDKFFVEELQKSGYDLDYKKVTEIYKKSRKNPAYIKRKIRNQKENEMLEQAMKYMENNKKEKNK